MASWYPLRVLAAWGAGLAWSCTTPLPTPAAPAPLHSGAPLTSCPRVGAPRLVGVVDDPRLREASGLMASRRHSGLLWVHNDSNHPEFLFGLKGAAHLSLAYTLAGARCVDWEDLALARETADGPWWLWVADTGTNRSPRRRVALYRVEEPGSTDAQGRLTGVTMYPVVYPDGGVHDSEALMYDPVDRKLVLVTKTTTGVSEVYGARLPLTPNRDNRLDWVAAIATPHTGERGSERITGGDISADGRFVLLRTYTRALLWPRPPGASMKQALSREPCNVPLVREQQGEAIAFDAEGRGYFTLSEGARQPLWYFPFVQGAP